MARAAAVNPMDTVNDVPRRPAIKKTSDQPSVGGVEQRGVQRTVSISIRLHPHGVALTIGSWHECEKSIVI